MLRDNGRLLNSSWVTRLAGISMVDLAHCEELERNISEYAGVNYCLTTCNGTSAILLSMIALGLKAGDEIIIPGFSYHAVYVAAKTLNLSIKFCDININSLCMDINILQDIITSDTKCIIFINHLGYVGEDLIQLQNICNENNILLMEDSAQGFGQFYQGKMAGTFGSIGIYSFSGTKLLRSGEGGCMVTNDQDIFNRAKELRDMGIGNYTLSPMSAKLLQFQLEDINSILDNRKKIQEWYKKYISIQQYDSVSTHSVCYITDKASQLHKMLKCKGIETRYDFYISMIDKDPSLKVSDYVKSRHIELPQSCDITEGEVKIICDEIVSIEKNNISASMAIILNKICK